MNEGGFSDLLQRNRSFDGGVAPRIDTRSIVNIQPADLDGVTRAHFFAGIGGWEYALRLAGWPESLPVWTGSCPCQPFSTAGKRAGTADPRHLWPEWFRLIRACRPLYVFGEQVASAIGHGWLDLVFADLEGEGYTCGAAVLGAHSVGAPHIRQRLYWVAIAQDSGHLGGSLGNQASQECAAPGGREERREGCGRHGERVDNAAGSRCDGAGTGTESEAWDDARVRGLEQGRRRGFWSDAIHVPCRDGVSRPIKPGLEPLVARLPPGVVPSGDPGLSEVENTAEARVMRLRGYGNAIVPQMAAEFVRAVMEVL